MVKTINKICDAIHSHGLNRGYRNKMQTKNILMVCMKWAMIAAPERQHHDRKMKTKNNKFDN
jgi:hypothetical protein